MFYFTRRKSGVSKVIRRGGLSANYQLHITFLMLRTKNGKRTFEFVKVIIPNIVSFFLPQIQ